MIHPLRHIKTRGSVTPSSPHLIKKMIDEIDFSHADVIVEFGIGDGCFTEELLKRMNKDAKLVCFEIDHDCCEIVRKKIHDERLILCETGAENVTEELERLKCANPDVVLSSLPLALLKKAVVASMFEQVVKLLSSGKLFLQYQYSLTNFKDVKNYFSSVKRKVEILNIPPAVIYICRN